MYSNCTIDEIIAYKELKDEVFDFGEGPMKIEEDLLSKGDIFCETYLTKYINNNDSNNKKEDKNKNKNKNKKNRCNNRYIRKKITKKKINKLKRIKAQHLINPYKPYLRTYESRKNKFFKKESNKIIRNYNNLISNGSSYKKICS